MLDNWIASLESGKCISENDLKKLCYMVKMILIEEANVQPVSAPVMICGDIHGQFYDMIHMFEKINLLFRLCVHVICCTNISMSPIPASSSRSSVVLRAFVPVFYVCEDTAM